MATVRIDIGKEQPITVWGRIHKGPGITMHDFNIYTYTYIEVEYIL